MPVDFTSVLVALSRAQVRFVVAGGLAVLLHGLDRLTADIDVAIDLGAEPARKAIQTLLALGYRPMAPVDALELADPLKRSQWQHERGMTVFSFWDPTHTRPTIDVFLTPVIDFEDLWAQATQIDLGPTRIRIASREHLIEMKAAAGRPQDLADIQRLRDC